jgi:DNA topoisomerase I
MNDVFRALADPHPPRHSGAPPQRTGNFGRDRGALSDELGVLLISDAFFRVGSDRYEQENNTFGITTLKKSHVTVAGGAVRFEYRGKRGIKQWQYIHVAEMVTFIKALLKTPGRRLFRYEEDGKWLDVAARDVTN